MRRQGAYDPRTHVVNGISHSGDDEGLLSSANVVLLCRHVLFVVRMGMQKAAAPADRLHDTPRHPVYTHVTILHLQTSGKRGSRFVAWLILHDNGHTCNTGWWLCAL